MSNKSPPWENYRVPAPVDGCYLAMIKAVDEDADCYKVAYEICVGSSAGYSFYIFLKTGRWPPIQQRIDKAGGKMVLNHLLRAANVSDIKDAQGAIICIELKHRTDSPYGFQVCRSFPRDQYHIRPEEIRVGTRSWGHGSAGCIHAAVIASHSGLPVLLADVHEIASPMVDWCANHNIALLPCSLRAGDYTTTDSSVIVDRKENLLELYGNFSCSANYASYSVAAMNAAAMRKKLLYIVGTQPEDHVSSLDEFANWKGQTPNDINVSGAEAAKNIQRSLRQFPNTDFIFTDHARLCEEIWRQIKNGIPAGTLERRPL